MRWKLLRRRLSVSAPRVIVRSHLPWPLRWAFVAVMLGFSAAIALWAFEFGKDIAGLDRNAKEELGKLRTEVAQLRIAQERSQSVANTAESLLRAERTAQDRLAQQLRQLEADNLALKADLGFFERLLPAGAPGALAVRALLGEPKGPGELRYQMLVMQSGKGATEFTGRYELTLTGSLDGKPWSQTLPQGAKTLKVLQYARIEGTVEYPRNAVVKSLQVKVTDAQGKVQATQQVKL